MQTKYIRTLKKARLKSPCKIKVSALAESGGKIIAVAYNKLGSTREGGYEYSRHAEKNLLRQIYKASTKLNPNAHIYIYREHGISGRELLSRPCKRCYLELAKANIKKIVFTVDGGWEVEIL